MSTLPADVTDRLIAALLAASGSSARAAVVAQFEAQHPDLAAEIRRWVDQATAGLFDSDSTACAKLGPFVIQSLLGRGGFGEVYRAEQTAPIRREVAVKLLKLGMDSRAILLRFERERDALAMMNHDAIAKIYDAGTAENGQPWFAMELVEGLPITVWCARHRASLRDRLVLFERMCRGVAHAHQKGVVHRDLKPTNVLVIGGIEDPKPKLIDFGIARALSEDRAGLTALTEEGVRIGTPAYMAPEQLLGQSDRIDTRSDVYSLGVLLFELLTGAGADAAHAKPSREATWSFQRDPRALPVRPSHACKALGDAKPAWAAQLLGDLDWITLRAMAPEPELRYASASALADDILRYCAHETVSATPPSLRYQLAKFAQRYRAQVIAAALVLTTAVLGAAVAIVFALEVAERAKENQILATAESKARAEAQQKEALAAAKVREFELLKVVVMLEDARAKERLLFPAAPALIPRLRDWLDRESAQLTKVSPTVRDAIAELRQLCLPWTEEQQRVDRESHPNAEEARLLRDQIGWVQRALDLSRSGGFREPPLLEQDRQHDLQRLILLAMSRASMDPDQRLTWGDEAYGVPLAREALSRARGTEREWEGHWVLAEALWSNGQDADCLKHADQSAKLTPEGERARGSKFYENIREEIAKRSERIASMSERLREIEPRLGERRTWTFPSDLQAESFLHAQLVQLDADLAQFEMREVASVRRRLRWAEHAIDRLRSGDLAQTGGTLASVRAAVASASAYAGGSVAVEAEDLVDLQPMGINPSTGLLEFYHLPSAWDGESEPGSIALPSRRSDGTIVVGVDTGIVFVLLPGGVAHSGSQASDPSAPWFDPLHRRDEVLHEVRLSPFLIARHEMTQAQWSRLWHGDDRWRTPSRYQPGMSNFLAGDVDGAHPVEQVDWNVSAELLAQWGLTLPTEAQWEHACRGGSSSRYGCEESSLHVFANLADATARAVGAQWQFEPFDDGFAIHAPVGSLRANAFGLHDMHGNVLEWCRDLYGMYGSERALDGLREVPYSEDRCLRGGSYAKPAADARSAVREHRGAGIIDSTIGLRASRLLKVR